MQIAYKETKNNSKTFIVDSVYYHSSYSPEKEAERFVSSINFSTPPQNLYVIESGLDYSYTFLKTKFPDTQIYNVSILNELDNAKTNSINYKNLSVHFENQESESILNSQIICWPTAEKLFQNEISCIFSAYKQAFEFAKTVLITKQFFEKKWFKNSIHFIKNVKQITSFDSINENILVVASGPSLRQNLKIIKENQNKFIIFALSSAINPLIKNGIIPDLCLSTDGGFWATKHLYPLIKNNIPLAVAAEGALPKQIFTSNTIIPLVYDQGLASKLYKTLDLPFVMAESCPTVSETAIKLASQITDKNVYIAGLDLSTRKGFTHCQPNILELENSLKDNRIKPSIHRITLSEINSKNSLQAYKTSLSYGKFDNSFRIIDDQITTKLESMKEIYTDNFINIVNNLPEIKCKNILKTSISINEENRKKLIEKTLKFIQNENNSDYWNKSLYPLDYSVMSHFSEEEQKEKILDIENKNNDYIEKLRKLINE